MKGFYRKKGGARDLLTKEKERITSGGGGKEERNGEVFHADCLLFVAGREEGAQITLLVFSQKMPD